MVGDRLKAGGGVAGTAVSGRFDGLAAPAGGLADLYQMSIRCVSSRADGDSWAKD